MIDLPLARKSKITVQDFEKEILIYDFTVGKAYCLNETSALIWNLCDGKNTVSEIAGLLRKKIKEPLTEELIWLALDQFKRDNSLENNESFEIDFNSSTRRQMIKKIGFASMITLPLVSSIVAPTAAQAASASSRTALYGNCPPGGSASCQSNNCVSINGGFPACCVPGASANGVFIPGSGSCSTYTSCSDYGTAQCCSRSAVPYSQLDEICAQNGTRGCICTA